MSAGLVWVVGDGGAAEVDHPVMVGTQENKVRQVGRSAVAPVEDVVGVAAAGGAGAAAVDAAGVAAV